jgi:hypothetical protein
MASLYTPSITNDDLLAQKNLRHRKINLDYEYISGFPHTNFNLLKGITWSTIDFTKANVGALNNNQGIYMFSIDPYLFSMCNKNSDIILYIGQAKKLRERLEAYFYYPNSSKPSDQERRYMILFYLGYLKLHYFQTNLSQADLDTLEYSLIDSIIPPYNQRFRSSFTQQYRKLLN